MLTKVLVKELIEDGRNLLSALKQNGFPVSAAFWVKLPDSDWHRLVIASPLAERLGQIAAYKQLQSILRNLSMLQLDFTDISVLGPNDADYKALRAIAFGPGRFGMGPAHGKMRNVTFQDSYIYQL